MSARTTSAQVSGFRHLRSHSVPCRPAAVPATNARSASGRQVRVIAPLDQIVRGAQTLAGRSLRRATYPQLLHHAGGHGPERKLAGGGRHDTLRGIRLLTAERFDRFGGDEKWFSQGRKI